jgi:DNA excision repair protein ERCC-2
MIVLPDDLLKEAVPGNIRKAEHFVAFLKRFVEYLKVSLPYCATLYVLTLPVGVDKNAGIARGCRDPTVIPAAFEGYHLHRTPTSSVGAFPTYQPIRTITRFRRFCAERLQSLVRTLELTNLDEYSSLQKVANFATLVATYEKGSLFAVFWKPVVTVF